MNMFYDLSARILSSLRSDCRLQPEDTVIVGVSGGIDSVFLLTRLHELGQPMIAAVFDHGLRPEAAEECSFVQSFCSERGIPCIPGSADVRSHAETVHTGIEAAARELRYRFLFDTAEKNQAAAVITAHHANDRAETVLLHLLRGTGIDGLSGMRPYALPNPFSETIPLIRPLLGITRAEIEAYMAANRIPYREDSSNTDTEFTRNRIRLDLIPKLEREYNPKIVESLCRLAETASADADLLNEITGSTANTSVLFFWTTGSNGAEGHIRLSRTRRECGCSVFFSRSLSVKTGISVIRSSNRLMIFSSMHGITRSCLFSEK